MQPSFFVVNMTVNEPGRDMQYACVLRGACVLTNTWQEGLVASHCQRAKLALAGVQGFCFSFA